jgi:hypothetical protein
MKRFLLLLICTVFILAETSYARGRSYSSSSRSSSSRSYSSSSSSRSYKTNPSSKSSSSNVVNTKNNSTPTNTSSNSGSFLRSVGGGIVGTMGGMWLYNTMFGNNSSKNYHNNDNVTSGGSNNGNWEESAPVKEGSNFPWGIVIIILCVGGFVVYKYRAKLFNR